MAVTSIPILWAVESVHRLMISASLLTSIIIGILDLSAVRNDRLTLAFGAARFGFVANLIVLSISVLVFLVQFLVRCSKRVKTDYLERRSSLVAERL
jgi:hypothetical protein